MDISALLGTGGFGAALASILVYLKGRHDTTVERRKLELENETARERLRLEMETAQKKLSLEVRSTEVEGFKSLAADLRADLDRIRNDLTLTQDDLQGERLRTDQQARRLDTVVADLEDTRALLREAGGYIRAREAWREANLMPTPEGFPHVPKTLEHIVWPDTYRIREPPGPVAELDE